ncbi:division/cell wall cluster transcriptional repressor MraZ [Neoroseomonas oryzicola]|uniref:Transcriptional regulator MraZ n=1 Tax=Neoroseomonas oryzicola TaxID=535904 RepID=A0A9X9WI20_9PROT|nr:cell division/cell wall cluster transcriptional repressor MraZ [Neoroseomonas oryzicola]MBR0659980.1 cell division/cell wall cluster transcriptional repressor MraZ [Neoroseomonas oryzicola]NKE16523.1 cell division/cell wall cluster transcriptional repressor MraZ [Neoroseomonas oryzicola]
MTQFLGTHKGKLDKKGRISVPAQFRAVLEALGTADIVLFPSFRHPCIEAWPAPAFAALSAGHTRLDVFSDASDNLAAALFATAHPARPDGEGRLVLPEDLVAEAGLSEAVSFIGANQCFQIWDTERALAHIRDARARARDFRLTLPSPARGDGEAR